MLAIIRSRFLERFRLGRDRGRVRRDRGRAQGYRVHKRKWNQVDQVKA